MILIQTVFASQFALFGGSAGLIVVPDAAESGLVPQGSGAFRGVGFWGTEGGAAKGREYPTGQRSNAPVNSLPYRCCRSVCPVWVRCRLLQLFQHQVAHVDGSGSGHLRGAEGQ